MKKKTSLWQVKLRTFKRVGTLAVAATFALSVPTVSNVVSKVAPSGFNISVAHADSSNMMDVNDTLTTFNVNENEDREHWTHTFNNDGTMQVDGKEFDLTGLKYIVKFPDELSDLLDNDYTTDYLFGHEENFGYSINPFNVTGTVIDKNGEEVSISRNEHKPYNYISINKETNSVEFDFDSFYSENDLEPYIRESAGEYTFNNLGFKTPIVVPNKDMLDNGSYEFKSAIVRGDSVDLDNVSDAHSETLEVDYNNDPEPEPEPDVDTSELEDLVGEANDYSEDDYTEDSFSALSDAIEKAEKVLEADDADQDAVDNALDELNTAIGNLEKASEPDPEPEVDTSKLKEDLKNAKKHDADDYTDESFGALSEAIENAEALLEDENADQDAVDKAVEGLKNAMSGLKKAPENPEEEPGEEPEEDTEENPKEEPEENPEEETDSGVNKDDLQEFVENLEDYNADKYTDDSFGALAAAFDHAKKVLSDEDATQKEVNQAKKILQDAMDNLVEKSDVDKSKLIALLKDAKSYDADAYGKNTFKVLLKAINKAEEVIDDAKATQKEVNAAFEELKNAIENLVKAVKVDHSDVSAVNDSITNDGSKLPDTATNNPLFILIGISLVTLGGALYVIRRKKSVQ